MAVFVCRTEEQEDSPILTERIEVRPWWVGGKGRQEFIIGSGGNFGENSNILIEIIYWVNEAQLFYTRNFIHNDVGGSFSLPQLQEEVEAFITGERDAFGFGDMLPETSLFLKRDTRTYQEQGQERTHTSYQLSISADTGAGVAMDSPGMRAINIEIYVEKPENGFEFLRQLVSEVGAVYQEKHPDPAGLPAGSSNWSLARTTNQIAYDRIAETYEEHYFSEPLLTEAFDAWLECLPPGGKILDVGCGHGKPVIARLLDKGFAVTGADLSPRMLERARQNFPNVEFVNQMASELTFEHEFDGACSLSSILYLDPIDLSHSLYRLQRALQADGYLFLYAYDLHPGYRGSPFCVDLEQWMWGWTYGMDEVVQILEEHGYFKVLKAQEVTSEQEKQERIEKWYTDARERYEKNQKEYPNMSSIEPDRNQPPALSYKYAILAQAQRK